MSDQRKYGKQDIHDAIIDCLPIMPVQFEQKSYDVLLNHCGAFQAEFYKNQFPGMNANDIWKKLKYETEYILGRGRVKKYTYISLQYFRKRFWEQDGWRNRKGVCKGPKGYYFVKEPISEPSSTIIQTRKTVEEPKISVLNSLPRFQMQN